MLRNMLHWTKYIFFMSMKLLCPESPKHTESLIQNVLVFFTTSCLRDCSLLLNAVYSKLLQGFK